MRRQFYSHIGKSYNFLIVINKYQEMPYSEKNYLNSQRIERNRDNWLIVIYLFIKNNKQTKKTYFYIIVFVFKSNFNELLPICRHKLICILWLCSITIKQKKNYSKQTTYQMILVFPIVLLHFLLFMLSMHTKFAPSSFIISLVVK